MSSVYFFPGSLGSMPSRTKARTTVSPSAMIATSGARTRDWIACDAYVLGEEIDKCGPAGGDVRVVLDVAFGHVLLGEIHVSCLEDLAPEVIDEPLVGRQPRIGACQHLLLVGFGDDRNLSVRVGEQNRRETGSDNSGQ